MNEIQEQQARGLISRSIWWSLVAIVFIVAELVALSLSHADAWWTLLLLPAGVCFALSVQAYRRAREVAS